MVYVITLESVFFDTATSKRILCYLKALNKEDVDCIWLSKKQDSLFNNPSSGVFEGIKYKVVGGCCRLKPRWKRLIFSLYNEICVLVYLFLHLRKGDAILIYFRECAWNVLTCLVAKLKKARVVADLCEIPSYGIKSQKAIRNKQQFEKCVMPFYDGVIAISDALMEYAHEHVNKRCDLVKIPIMVEYSKYNIPDKSECTNVPYIFHAGTLTEKKDGILGMVEAFGKACKQIQEPFEFILTGTVDKSPNAKELLRILDEYKIKDRVYFTGHLNADDIKRYLESASMVIINKIPNEQNKYGFSNKLGEYLAAGKAIIITQFGEAMNWLQNNKNALIIPTLDNDAMANAIIRLFNDNELRKQLGENAKVMCENSFHYGVWSKTLAEIMNQK